MTISSLVGMDSSTYKLIREGIDASRVRAEAISNNMANINTRNYKRFNVVFEENLKNTSDKSIELIFKFKLKYKINCDNIILL